MLLDGFTAKYLECKMIALRFRLIVYLSFETHLPNSLFDLQIC